MKRFINSLLTLLLAFLGCTINSYAYEIVDATQKIYDYGDFLTLSEETTLKSMIDDYTNKYDLDMVIVTKEDYPYSSMRSYAQDFYDYNDFGVGDTKDGILLFFNIDSEGPIVEIVTTGEGIRMYDDARIDNLLNSMSSVKYDGNYTIIETFIKRADDYASQGVPSSNKNTYIDEYGDLQYKKSYPVIPILIISGVITLVVMLIMINKNKMVKKATNASQYLDMQSLNISTRTDRFMHTHTNRVRIQSNNGSGGSSISRGSSGRSHGGGGGRL